MTTRQTVTIQGPDDRQKIATWARNVEPGTVVTFRKKSRSTEQSAKMWAMLHEVASQVEWYGQKIDAEDWKDMFTASLRHARVVPGIDKGTFVPLGMHTSTMTIEEMTNLIELIYAFGAEHGVVFKDPKEQDSGNDPQPEAEGAALSSPQETADDIPSSSAVSTLTSSEVRQHLMDFARKALVTAGDKSLPDPKRLELVEFMQANYRDVLPDTEWGKLSTIMIGLQAVLSGKRTIEQARRFFAVDLLETTVEELGG